MCLNCTFGNESSPVDFKCSVYGWQGHFVSSIIGLMYSPLGSCVANLVTLVLKATLVSKKFCRQQ